MYHKEVETFANLSHDCSDVLLLLNMPQLNLISQLKLGNGHVIESIKCFRLCVIGLKASCD